MIVSVNTVLGPGVGAAARVVWERGLRRSMAAPVTRGPECASYIGRDERGAGQQIQSLQNHTGTCSEERIIQIHTNLIYVKTEEPGITELCTVSSEMHLAPSCIQQGGPPVSGALGQGKNTLSWAVLLHLHFSFPERDIREEINW